MFEGKKQKKQKNLNVHGNNMVSRNVKWKPKRLCELAGFRPQCVARVQREGAG